MKLVKIAASLLLVSLHLHAEEAPEVASKAGEAKVAPAAPAAPTAPGHNAGTVAKGKKPEPKKDGGHKK